MSQTERILLCTDHLPPSDGGVEQVVQELAIRIARRGYDVGVYALVEPAEPVRLRAHPEIDLYTSTKIDLTETIGLQSAVSPGAVREFKTVLQEHDPDVVHVHNRFFFSSYVALLHAALSDRPLVTTMHLGDIDHIDGLGGTIARRLQSVFARALVRRSDAVLCVSDAVATVADRLGVAAPSVVRNAVDIERFSVPETPFSKRLLYVGRLVRNNGPGDLIEAFPAIRERHPDAKLDIVGSGTLRSDLERRVEALGLGDAVTFYGFVESITEVYERASVFCRPSYSEGLPLTLLESMATYTVPVVTPIAGTREVVTADTGRFVTPGDPKSIATTVGDLFDDPATVTEMGRAARTRIENEFTWDERTATVLDQYDAVTGQKFNTSAHRH